MWLIVLTESLKEREAIETLRKLPDYKGHYLPLYRKESRLIPARTNTASHRGRNSFIAERSSYFISLPMCFHLL